MRHEKRREETVGPNRKRRRSVRTEHPSKRR
jgi:hypothetical protein